MMLKSFVLGQSAFGQSPRKLEMEGRSRMTQLPNEFADALISAGPHPQISSANQIFAPFVGSWRLQVSWFDMDGRLSRQERGEWHFSWVLEGRAIQDIWIVPPRDARNQRSDLYDYGTSLRFFDPEIQAWRSTWTWTNARPRSHLHCEDG